MSAVWLRGDFVEVGSLFDDDARGGEEWSADALAAFRRQSCYLARTARPHWRVQGYRRVHQYTCGAQFAVLLDLTAEEVPEPEGQTLAGFSGATPDS